MGFVRENWRRCLVREVCLEDLLCPRFFLAGNESKYSLRNWSTRWRTQKEGGRGVNFREVRLGGEEMRWEGGEVGGRGLCKCKGGEVKWRRMKGRLWRKGNMETWRGGWRDT